MGQDRGKPFSDGGLNIPEGQP